MPGWKILTYCPTLSCISLALSLSLCCPGGNYRGVFALGLVQGEWKMYVKWPLDREERNLYIINVTASDGLFVSQAIVEVTVIDTNDNRPICDQVRNKTACCSI